MATLKDLLDSGMSRDEINALLSQSTVGTSGFQQDGYDYGPPVMQDTPPDDMLPPQSNAFPQRKYSEAELQAWKAGPVSQMFDRAMAEKNQQEQYRGESMAGMYPSPQSPPRQFLSDLAKPQQMPEGYGPAGMVEQAPLNTIRNNSTGVVTKMPSSGQRSHDVFADGAQVLHREQLADGTTRVTKRVPALDGFGRQSAKVVQEIEIPDYMNPAMLAKQKYEGQAANIAHTQMQTDPAKAAEYARQVAEGKQKGEMTGFGNTAQQTATGANALSGLPPVIADQVKALAEGRMAFPSGFALKSPYWQQMLQMVSQYDPNFDAINYNARSKTRQDFTSGKSAENIKSLNTAIGHLDTITQKFDALENSSFPSYNTSANWIGSKLGNEKIQSAVGGFDTAKLAVSGEMAKVFRSVGMSQQEIEHWMDRLSSSQSPADFKSTIKTATDLMGGRLDAIGDQYTKGMGKSTQGLDLLSPDAKKQFQKIQGGGTQKLTSTDGEAMAWAMKNPNDPRAAAIKERLGVR